MTYESPPVPIPGYDQLSDRGISDRLAQLSHVELAAVETYDMCGTEPLPGYDSLTTEHIAEALADADAETDRAVRDYERKVPTSALGAR